MEELTTELIIPDQYKDRFRSNFAGTWFKDLETGETHSKKELIEILNSEQPCNQN